MTLLIEASPDDVGMDVARLMLLKERMAEWCDGRYLRTGSVLIARHGRIVFDEVVGPLTHEPGSPVAPLDALYNVASISKTMTTAAAMILVEDGLLALNRPIQEYLPEVCGEGTQTLEVQHLLTHTAGFSDETFSEKIFEATDLCRDMKVAEGADPHPYIQTYLDRTWDFPCARRPGSEMEYCSHGMVLLVEIIRRLAGQPFEAFVQERLLDPLGMSDTTLCRKRKNQDRYIVRGPEDQSGWQKDDRFSGIEGDYSQDAPWGFSSMRTSTRDFARFCQMFLDKGRAGDRRVLSAASVHELTHDQIPGIKVNFGPLVTEGSWGLGWTIQSVFRWPWVSPTLNPPGSFYHTGAGGNIALIDPQSGLIVLCFLVGHDFTDDGGFLRCPRDLIINMAMASVLDG